MSTFLKTNYEISILGRQGPKNYFQIWHESEVLFDEVSGYLWIGFTPLVDPKSWFNFSWIIFDPQLIHLLLNWEFTNVILINTNFAYNIIKVKLKKIDAEVTYFYPFLSIIFPFVLILLNKCFYPLLPIFTHRFPC